MKNSELEAIDYRGLDGGKGLHAFRARLWLLADPNKETYNPYYALMALEDAIKTKWQTVAIAREERGMEPPLYSQMEKVLPIIDQGDRSIDRQLRDAVREGLRYVGSPDIGWRPEYPHEIARRNLGFTHPSREDTPEQRKSLAREELRVVHETELRGAIYNLGEAVDEQHRAYLQSKVDQCAESVKRYAAPEKSAAQTLSASLPAASGSKSLSDNFNPSGIGLPSATVDLDRLRDLRSAYPVQPVKGPQTGQP